MSISSSGKIEDGQHQGKEHIHKKRKIFSQKVFVERESLLTTSPKTNSGIRTLESIFVSFLLILWVHITVDQYFETGSLLPDLRIFYYAFSKPEYTYPPLFLIYFISFMIVPLVVVISQNRNVRWCLYLPFYGIL